MDLCLDSSNRKITNGSNVTCLSKLQTSMAAKVYGFTLDGSTTHSLHKCRLSIGHENKHIGVKAEIVYPEIQVRRYVNARTAMGNVYI